MGSRRRRACPILWEVCALGVIAPQGPAWLSTGENRESQPKGPPVRASQRRPKHTLVRVLRCHPTEHRSVSTTGASCGGGGAPRRDRLERLPFVALALHGRLGTSHSWSGKLVQPQLLGDSGLPDEGHVGDGGAGAAGSMSHPPSTGWAPAGASRRRAARLAYWMPSRARKRAL